MEIGKSAASLKRRWTSDAGRELARTVQQPMDQVDLVGAILDGCEFRGFTFDSVMLPPDPALIRIRDLQTIDRAVAALASMPSDPHTAIAEIVLDHARQVLEMGGEELLNLRDVEPAGEILSNILKEAAKG